MTSMILNDLKAEMASSWSCIIVYCLTKNKVLAQCVMLLKLQNHGSRQRLVLNLNAKEFLVRKGGFRTVPRSSNFKMI